MKVIRPIELKDFDALVSMAFRSQGGITSLPKNPALLEKKIKRSLKAFKAPTANKTEQLYLFVLEDLATGIVGGLCGIAANLSANHPRTLFRLEEEKHVSKSLKINKVLRTLRIITSIDNVSELCSLYMQPEFRHGGSGRLLSLSRLLFIASHRKRFANRLMAVMRGAMDSNDNNPVWECIGRHCFNKTFAEMLTLMDEGLPLDPALWPRHPLYIDLLPFAAQQTLGQTHEHTRPALQMLEDEGLVYVNEVDVLDGGPVITGAVNKLRVIKEQQQATLGSIVSEPLDAPELLICNDRLDFRVCLAPIVIKKGKATLSQEVAEALQVQCGDSLRIVDPAAAKRSLS